MPSTNDKKNAEHQRESRNRRARAYMIVKALAQRAGYMSNERDAAGLDKFMDDFEIHGHEIDWFEAADDIGD